MMKRLLMGSILLLSALLIVLVLILGWAVGTTSGAKWLVKQASVAEPRLEAAIIGGRLLTGVTLDYLRWDDTDIQLSVSEGALSWNGGCLLLKQCDLVVTAASINGRYIDTQAPSAIGPFPESEPFSLPFSRLKLRADIGTASLQMMDQTIDVGAIGLSADVSDAHVRLDALTVDTIVRRVKASESSLQLTSEVERPVVEPLFSPFDVVDIPIDLSIKTLRIGSVVFDDNQPDFMLSNIEANQLSLINSVLNAERLSVQVDDAQISVSGQTQLLGDWPTNLSVSVIYGQGTETEVMAQTRLTGDLEKIDWTLAMQSPIALRANGSFMPLGKDLPISGALFWEQSIAKNWLPPEIDIQSGVLHFDGTLTNTSIALALETGVRDAADNAITDIAATAQWHNNGVIIEKVTFSQLAGSATATGNISLGQEAQWQLLVTTHDFMIPAGLADSSATFNGTLSSTGTLVAEFWETAIGTEDFHILWNDNVFDADGDIRLNSDFQWATDVFSVKSGANQLLLSGGFNDQWDGDLTLVVSDASDLVSDINGTAKATVSVTGPLETPEISFNLAVSDLKWQDVSVNNMAMLGAMHWQEKKPQIALNLEATQVHVGEQQISRANLVVDGTADNHDITVSVASDIGDLVTALSGSLEDFQRWSGSLNTALMTSEVGTWSLDKPTNIDIDFVKSVALVGAHCWSQNSAQFCANQPLALGLEGNLDMSFSHVDMNQFAAYMPAGVRTTGLIDGHLVARWADTTVLAASATLSGQKGSVTVSTGLSQTLTLPYDNWELSAEQVADGWTLDASLVSDGISILNSQGKITGMPSADVPLVASATLTDLPVALFSPLLTPAMAVSGTLSAKIQLTGSVGNPDLQGSLRLQGGSFQDADLPLSIEALGLTISILNDQAELTGDFAMGAGRGAITGKGEWRDGHWWADVALLADNLSLFEQSIPQLKFGFVGGLANHQFSLQVTHELAAINLIATGGLTEAQHWLGTLATAQLESELGSWVIDQPASVDVDITESVALIGAHCWSQKDAQVCANQTLTLGVDGRVDMSLSNLDMDLFDTYMPEGFVVAGRVDGALTAHWANTQLLAASARLTGQPGTVTLSSGLSQPLSIPYENWEVRAEQVANGWTLDASLLGDGIGSLNSHADITGMPSTESPIVASATLTDLSVAMFAPLFAPTMGASGMLSAQFQMSGKVDNPDLQGSLQLKDGGFQDFDLPLSIEDVGLNISILNDQAELTGAFAMGAGRGVVSGQGEWRDGDWWADVTLIADNIMLVEQSLSHVQFGFVGGLSNHQINVQVDHELGAATLSVSGGLTEDQHWLGTLGAAQLQSELGHWLLDAPTHMDINLTDSTAEFGAHCWFQDAARLCANQTLVLGVDGSVDTTLTNFDMKHFSDYMPEGVKTTGLVDGSLTARWVGTDVFDVSATLSGQPGTVTVTMGSTEPLLLPFDNWQVRARQKGNDWSLDATLAGKAIGTLNSHADITGTPSLDAPLVFTARMNDMPVALFSALIDPNMTASGNLSAQIQVDGSAAAPELKGTLSLSEGTFQMDGVPVAVEDILVEVQVANKSADITGSFNIGSGKGHIVGSAILSDAGWTSTIEMSGVNMMITDPMMTLAISPKITLSISEAAVDVKGVIDVPSGNIKIKSLPESAVSLSGDVIVVQDNISLEPTPIYQITTNVDLRLGSAVFIEAYGLKSQLVGGITVRQKDVADPQLYGQIETKDGSFKALGAHLEIRRGKLVFSGPMDRPMLDLEAVRVVNGITAGILANGIVTEPEITLFSEPAMTQAEILSYIMRGQPLDGGAISEGLLATKVAMGIGIYGSDSPLTSVSEKLGIEDFNIDAEGSADSARIALAGYLSPRLYFKYGVGVMNAANEITLRYKLLPRLFLESVTGINSAVDVIYTFEF